MEWLSSVLMAVQVISSLSVIVLVLLQQGKGADMGSAFGSGSAGSLFGAAGAANFLSRTTKWVAIVFFASTAGLAWLSHTPQGRPDAGVMQGFEVPQAPGAVPTAPGSVPAVPGAGAGAVPDASVPQAPATPADAPSAAQPGASADQVEAPTEQAEPAMSAPSETPADAPAADAQAPASEEQPAQ